MPLMAMSRLASSSARKRFNTELQTTILLLPVSSSNVMNITPVAVPGRWRQVTTPAT